jgi:hypothetical protein
MGFLDRLFGGGKKSGAVTVEEAAAAAECPHTALIPRWSNADDMGKEDKISGYRCEGCGGSFSREEGDRLMAQEEERIRVIEEGRTS